MRNDIHPKIKEFQQFVNEHPPLIRAIRQSGKSLQYYYNQWLENGEKDPFFQTILGKQEQEKTPPRYKRNSSTNWFDKISDLTKQIDLKKTQQHVQKLDETIETVQELLEQLATKEEKSINRDLTHPFHRYRD